MEIIVVKIKNEDVGRLKGKTWDGTQYFSPVLNSDNEWIISEQTALAEGSEKGYLDTCERIPFTPKQYVIREQ